jgi:hypothetical protein
MLEKGNLYNKTSLQSPKGWLDPFEDEIVSLPLYVPASQK